MNRAGIFVFILMFTFACVHDNKVCDNFGEELIISAEEEGELRCKLSQANKEAVKVWNDYNEILSSSFAPTTNNFIRSKMLEMRNAELLRMFQSFDSLDTKARLALESTEEKDSSISRQMLLIQKKLDELEERKMSTLLKIEVQCPEKLAGYRDQYSLTMKNICDAL